MPFELFICSLNALLKVVYSSFILYTLLCDAIPVTTVNVTYKSQWKCGSLKCSLL